MRAVPLLLVMLLAGCLDAGSDVGAAASPAAATEPSWPDPAAATVRPGVKVEDFCTSNFVFASPDNATLYLGTAAHCFGEDPPGTRVKIGPDATGTLFYSSYWPMGYQKVFTTPFTVRSECANESASDACVHNDFALIRIDDEHRAKVHPAMLGYGGPVALADSATVARGDKVYTYGNSTYRHEVGPIQPRDGLVAEARPWLISVYTTVPGVPGDSGSAVLDGDGAALGILITLNGMPPASNGVTPLDKALAYAKEHAGLDVRLATWGFG